MDKIKDMIEGHRRQMRLLKSKFNEDEISYECFQENYSAHEKIIESLKKEMKQNG